jgi:hypothetical protein
MLVNPLHCSKQIGDLQSLQEAIRDGESQKHNRSTLKEKEEKKSYWSLEVNRIKKQKKIKNEQVTIVVLDCHGSRKHILELQS